MYARILLVGDASENEASFFFRLQCALRNLGHAVRACNAGTGIEACSSLSLACEAFRPTLILLDGRNHALPEGYASILEKQPCCKAILANGPIPSGIRPPFDVVLAEKEWRASSESPAPQGDRQALPFPCVPDAQYSAARISDPAAARDAIACMQCFTEARSAALRRACDSAGIGTMITPHPSWAHPLHSIHPGANEAYYLRTARYCVYFSDPHVLSTADIAMRIAEGCIVLVEDEALALLPESPIKCALAPFDIGMLHEVVAELEGSEEKRRALADRQRAALGQLPPLEDGLVGLLSAIDGRQRSGGKAPVLAFDSAALRFVLFGWFGAHNFGDDLLMRLTILRIQERYPHSEISVIGADAEAIRSEYGYESAAPHEKYKIRRLLRGAQALVFCGGLLFDDPLAQTAGELEMVLDPWIEPTGQAAVCLLAHLYGAKQVFLGIGGGPIENEATRMAVRTMGLAGARFLPRDAQTCELLLASEVSPSQISQKADLAFGARQLIEGSSGSLPDGLSDANYFTVSLRRWHLNPPDFTLTVAKTIDSLCEKTGFRAVFVPFDEEDVSIHQEVLGHMEREDDALLLAARPDEKTMFRLLEESRFAFAMRLHCSILHHVLGKPAIGLNYNDKVEAHFRLMGQEHLLLPLNFEAEQAIDAASEILSGSFDARSALLPKLDRQASLVNEAFDELFDLVDEGERPAPLKTDVYYPRTISLANERSVLAEGMLHAAQEEIERERSAREQAQESERAVRASTTFRVGRLFVKPFSAIKRRRRASNSASGQ